MTGKKIFILYPDSFLRTEIFNGSLRNQFQIYFIFDYEKIKPLIEYYPGSIICLNLVDNDLRWLIDELTEALSDLSEAEYPELIALSDKPEVSSGDGFSYIDCSRGVEDIRQALQGLFIELGGKGRRNFVRYGGGDEAVAVIKLDSGGQEIKGTVHDISASGLSCSFAGEPGIPISNNKLDITLYLSDIKLELSAIKILERDFSDRAIHVLQFDKSMQDDRLVELYKFIHQSIDSSMEEFIKKLSN